MASAAARDFRLQLARVELLGGAFQLADTVAARPVGFA
jgi:hypothetical protein